MVNNLDKTALQLANNSLERRFDAEAYIVKCLAEMRIANNPIDLVPNSSIDENIQELLNQFVNYMKSRSSADLSILLSTLRQIVSELYHSCQSKEQKELIKGFIEKCNCIN